MIPQAQLMDYFVEVTDTLISDFDVVDFLHNLTVKAAEASGAAAVGLVLIDHHDLVRFMASSNEEGKLLELLQIQNAEGPCLDAMRTGLPVVNAHLGDAGDRWPVFAPAARAAGFQSVHAFPMRLKDQTIGALNIFGVDDARFDPEDVRVVQALADVATIAILHDNGHHQTELIAEQLQAALHSRIIVEQAKGALARSRSIASDEAFEVLRTRAQETHQKLADVARAVITDLEPPVDGRLGTPEVVDLASPGYPSPSLVRQPAKPTDPRRKGRSMQPLVWPYWDNGETITPCGECGSWELQLFHFPGSGTVMVREWHDAQCPLWDRIVVERGDPPSGAGATEQS